MSVPEFSGYWPSEEGMDSAQLSFYRDLEKSLIAGDYIDVEGQISYVFVYIYKLLVKWDKKGFEELYEYLIYMSELYKKETKLADYCKFWADDCLLGLEKYDIFLEKTEPNEPFGTSTHYSNLRLNIQKHLGLEANPIDIILIAGGRKTKFITNNQGLYKDKIREVFSEYAQSKSGWFPIFEEWLSNKQLYTHSLFSGAPFWSKPNLSFGIVGFYSAYDHLSIIKNLSKEAENAARVKMGVPKIGEGWVSETELFKLLERRFYQTRVIQHGQPSWLGRQH